MIRNGLYNVLGAVIRAGLTLLTVPFLIRLLGIETYGLWTLATTVAGVFVLAEAGLSLSTTVFLSRDLANQDTVGLSATLSLTVGGMVILATTAAILLWLSTPLIVSLFGRLRPEQVTVATTLIRMSAFLVWARLLQLVFVSIEQSFNRYDVLNILNTAQAVLVSIGTLVIAWRGQQLELMMQWHIIATVVVMLGHLWVSYRLVAPFDVRPRWDRPKAVRLAHFSGITWLSSLGGVLFTQMDRLIVGAVLGTAMLGIYAAITSITVQINAISALAVQPLLPNLSEMLAQIPPPLLRIRRVLARGFALNGASILVMAGGLIVAAPLIVRLVFPESMTVDAVQLLRIAALAYGVYSLNAVGYYLLLALNGVTTLMILTIISGVVAIAMITAGANLFGIQGAIWGNFGFALSLFMIPLSLRRLQQKGIPVQTLYAAL